MKWGSTVLNPVAPVATAGAIALGLTLAGSPAALAGPPDGWFGLFAAPRAQSAEAAEGTIAPPPAGVDDSSADLRGRLAAAERRVAELENELEKTRAQAAWLGEELEASWRWIEELNAVLADARTADDAPAATAALPDAAERPAGDRAGAAPAEDGIAARLARALDALGASRPRSPGPGAGPFAAAPDTPEASAAPAPERPPAAPQAGPAEDAAPHYAATQAVNLRAGPNISAEVLAVVEADDTVRLLDRDRGWFRVRYTTPSSREVTGWVYGEFLREVEPGDALAGLAPPA